jgi:hypothetical protein
LIINGKTACIGLPNATYALEDYKVDNPDFEKFPALKGVEGYEVYLEHGDTLFMPTGMWHWMKYIDGSFSFKLKGLGSIHFS